MKRYNILLDYKLALVAIICAFTLWSCNRPVTKSDVQDQVKDAQEATQEAQEETQAAMEAREQYSKDDRQARIQGLEDRSREIDNRIKELKKSVKKSSNQAATVDIESAIETLQDEKSDLNEKISDVEAIEDEDWSASYEELNLAIGRIEGEINKLSQSLDANDQISIREHPTYCAHFLSQNKPHFLHLASHRGKLQFHFKTHH